MKLGLTLERQLSQPLAFGICPPYFRVLRGKARGQPGRVLMQGGDVLHGNGAACQPVDGLSEASVAVPLRRFALLAQHIHLPCGMEENPARPDEISLRCLRLALSEQFQPVHARVHLRHQLAQPGDNGRQGDTLVLSLLQERLDRAMAVDREIGHGITALAILPDL